LPSWRGCTRTASCGSFDRARITDAACRSASGRSTNSFHTARTATAEEGAFDTGNIDPGASATVTFDAPGTYTYVCTDHSSMTGVIVVT